MIAASLREARNAKPFRPFRIRLADGRSVPVRLAEQFMVSPRGRTAAIFGLCDKLEIIDVHLVQSIEFIRNSHRGNGKGRARRAK